MTQTLIAPSILSADFACLGTEIQRLEAGGADWIHVDVMDGMYVPNLTLGPPVIKAIRKCTQLPFDVHLMIEQPERYLSDFRKAGADIITVHQETCPHLHRTLAEIRKLGCKAGVSLNPSTPVETLSEVLDSLDMILIMSVNPGFGGQSFIEASLDKIARTHQLLSERLGTGHSVLIEVDGGVSPVNAASLRNAGANVLVAGSAVFGAPDIAQAIGELRGTASVGGKA
ncbi:MAG: ribulose-phosphate 3-epimerase [Candidatus Melainabacteria bacterium]